MKQKGKSSVGSIADRNGNGCGNESRRDRFFCDCRFTCEAPGFDFDFGLRELVNSDHPCTFFKIEKVEFFYYRSCRGLYRWLRHRLVPLRGPFQLSRVQCGGEQLMNRLPQSSNIMS